MPFLPSGFAPSRMGARRVEVAPTPTIDTAGSVSPDTWQAGTEETLTRGTASAIGGGTISYELQILIDGVAAASGTGATLAYTPVSGDVSDAYVAQWRATETGGTADGTTGWQTVASGTVAGIAPTASNALADLTLTQDVAMTPVDVAADFDLGTPTATVALQSGTLPDGLSFDGTTLSGTPTTEAGAVTLTFRATNVAGTADTAFQVTVEAAVSPPTFPALNVGPQDGNDLPITATKSGGPETVYFSLVGIAAGGTAVTDAAKILAGTDQGDSDSLIWIDHYEVVGDITDQVVPLDREPLTYLGDMDFYAVFSTAASGGAVSEIQSDLAVTITITSASSGYGIGSMTVGSGFIVGGVGVGAMVIETDFKVGGGVGQMVVGSTLRAA